MVATVLNHRRMYYLRAELLGQSLIVLKALQSRYLSESE